MHSFKEGKEMKAQGSFLLTPEKAEQAIGMVRPAIAAAMNSGLMKRHHLHIVVMDPAIAPYQVDQGEQAIVGEASFGHPGEWENNYAGIARAKAIAAWRTGQPTHMLVQAMPYLLVGDAGASDTIYWGSVNLLGVPVGASGVQPWFDEWVAYSVASACRALCIGEMQESYIPDRNRDFLFES